MSAGAGRGVRRMGIWEVDGADLVLVVRRVRAHGGDPSFSCDGCPAGPHWHVNNYWRPGASDDHRRRACQFVRDFADEAEAAL